MIINEKLRNVLNTIEDPISDFIISLVDNQDYEYVDVKEDAIDKVVYKAVSSNRVQYCKLGRFINKFENDFTAREIEIFVNSYKGKLNLNSVIDNIYIGDGDDILFAYNTNNYSKMTGSLRGSCMNNQVEERYNIYKNNPNKIKIAILKDDEGKVIARAILWKNCFMREGETAEDRNASETFKATMMDRVYAIEDHYIDMMQEWARSKGYYIRLGGLRMIRPDGEQVNVRCKCVLKNFKYDHIPYLDTMRSISTKGTISNKRWKGDTRFI